MKLMHRELEIDNNNKINQILFNISQIILASERSMDSMNLSLVLIYTGTFNRMSQQIFRLIDEPIMNYN